VALRGEKILLTGPAGQIAFPLGSRLALDNEVWGVARFSGDGDRARVEAAGMVAHRVDLAEGDFSGLPDDFTVVLHLATFQGPEPDHDWALRVNAEGTGLLLAHCRSARAALVMSTTGVYKPVADPWHAFLETDPLGEAVVPHCPTYPISKIAEEAVARFCARAYDLPVVIARMNASYGPGGGLPAYHLDMMVKGEVVPVRHDPCPYSPIHDDDVFDQLEALLGLASAPATIVNWGGDEPVSPQQWCALLSELIGLPALLQVRPVSGSQQGVVLDNAKRLATTGPCRVGWRDGMARMVRERYPDGVAPGRAVASKADRLVAAGTTPIPVPHLNEEAAP
jgi:nucleoside-diphosphate-sugar epimerase